jgi:hypothetical protein
MGWMPIRSLTGCDPQKQSTRNRHGGLLLKTVLVIQPAENWCGRDSVALWKSLICRARNVPAQDRRDFGQFGVS